MSFAVIAGLGFAWSGYHGAHTPSALSLHIPQGWKYGQAPAELAAALRMVQAQTGMEMKLTLTSDDGRAVAAVYVRPLLGGENTSAAALLPVLVEGMHLAGCSPAAVAEDSFAQCSSSDEANNSATAVIVPARVDRYFLIFAKSLTNQQQAASLIKDVMWSLRVKD